jgi:hypothetical protein
VATNQSLWSVVEATSPAFACILVACTSVFAVLFTVFAVSSNGSITCDPLVATMGNCFCSISNSQLPETKGLSLEEIDELVSRPRQHDVDNETNRLVTPEPSPM